MPFSSVTNCINTFCIKDFHPVYNFFLRYRVLFSKLISIFKILTKFVNFMNFSNSYSSHSQSMTCFVWSTRVRRSQTGRSWSVQPIPHHLLMCPTLIDAQTAQRTACVAIDRISAMRAFRPRNRQRSGCWKPREGKILRSKIQ